MKKLISALKISFLTTITLFSLVARPDELMLTQEEAAVRGYVPYEQYSAAHGLNSVNITVPQELTVPLKWPFEQPYSQSRIGNNFLQFQPYQMPGYHMGDDMILESNSWALAPIDGRLEAGHYSYTDLPNGNRIKQWIPWPGRGDDNYFEVAVIDANGTRYELHHVDPRSLPSEIIDILSKNGSVVMGQRLGRVVPWSTPFHYVHVHVNIFDSAGTALNPESIFEIIPDSIAPDVSFLAIYADGTTEWLKDSAAITKPVKSFVISGSDSKDLHQYVQALPFIEFTRNGAVTNKLDFRRTLLDDAGVFTDIRGVYPNSIRLSDKTVLSQPYGYYPEQGTKFHQVLTVNAQPTGQSFQLKAQDIAGNSVVLSGKF